MREMRLTRRHGGAVSRGVHRIAVAQEDFVGLKALMRASHLTDEAPADLRLS
jgi:hypothetical protein